MALSLPSVEDVRAIIETSLLDGAIETLIEDAALIAEGCPAIETYSDARQAAIIKWLTAHLIDQSGKSVEGSGKITSERIGDAARTFASGTLGAGILGSSYGAQAAALDQSGCLSDLGKRRATFKVLSR